tara:strand:+ start:60 stop:209 length:150 start_codon:yes stop_codon:yes gene_type:complete
MQTIAREFHQLKKLSEYSDLLEDTDWLATKTASNDIALYSDLLEDTDWV